MMKKPDYLTDEASQEWDRIVPWLEERGKEVDMDASALAGYCLAVAKMIRCEKLMAGQPYVVSGAQGGLIPNPMLAIQSRAIAEVQRLAKEFGFTPKSRGNPQAKRGQMPESMRKALGK